MENAVFIHLITAGWHVTVGYSNHTEIDFIATKGGDKMYVQVCYLLQSEETIQREFGNLLSIPDNFRKLVVSLDDLMPGSTYKGIEQVHLKDFLH